MKNSKNKNSFIYVVLHLIILLAGFTSIIIGKITNISIWLYIGLLIIIGIFVHHVFLAVKDIVN